MNRAPRSCMLAALLLIMLGGHAHAQLVDNGDGTVTDAATSIMWLQEVAGGSVTWATAETWAANLMFAGADDWRMPTLAELNDLYSRGLGGPVGGPLVNTAPFVFQGFPSANADPDAVWYWIWSSTPGSIPITKKAAVNFFTGASDEWLGGSTMHRWAVHDVDDGDGIARDVDDDPAQHSDAFSNGATNGHITDRGDQELTVTASNGGILIEASGDGGPAPATITVCDGEAELTIAAGTSVTVACTSVTVVAVSGDVDVTFLANGWPQARLTMPMGHQIRFDAGTLELAAGNGNANPLVIITENADITLAPGTSETIVKCSPPPPIPWWAGWLVLVGYIAIVSRAKWSKWL